jgi:hypothetical protein
MNINYEKRENNFTLVSKFDPTKNNILLLGKADTYEQRCAVINPRGKKNASELYGEDSELYKSYAACIDITGEYNVFTVNCRTYLDFLTVMESVLHYNFSYVVPMGIKLEDTFFNTSSQQYEYYIDYFLYLIETYQSITTIIMTNNHSKDYETIDRYLKYCNKAMNEYRKHVAIDNDNFLLLEKNGSDLIYILNNLENIPYANAVLAAQLSNENYTMYPRNVSFKTYYDIDKNDIGSQSYCYHKYNYLLGSTSIDNLINLRLIDDVYKNALIDTMIKTVLRKLNLDKFKGRLYYAYIKLQIQNALEVELDSMLGLYFKDYKINNVGFVKTEITSGYIYIELSVMPYGFIDYINVVMEV